MSDRIRYMRLILFFDLPVETAKQRRAYSHFRRWLLKNGYLMIQESVYSKLAIDGHMVDSLLMRLCENRPPEGLVQVLKVTEKQYAGMANIVGNAVESNAIQTMDTLVVI